MPSHSGHFFAAFRSVLATAALLSWLTVSSARAEDRSSLLATQPKPAAAKADALPLAPQTPDETQATEYDPVERPANDLELDAAAKKQAEATARFMHGLILEDEGEFEAAIGEFQKVIDIDPSNWTLASRLATELVKRSQIARAIDILKNTAEARPKDARPLLLLANIYNRNLGKPQVALRYAEQALKLSPDTFDPYATLHEIYTALGNTAKAKETLKTAELHNSTNGEFWLRLGTMRAAMELDGRSGVPPSKEVLQPINAIFEKAAVHGADNINILAAVADYYVLTLQLARSIPYYEKAVDLEPSRMDLLEKLGRSYQEAERHSDAIRIFKRMVEVNPMQPGIYYVLGLLYSKVGKPEEAANAFERSAEINPTEPNAFLEAARLLVQINQHERAIALLDKATKQFPEFELEINFQLLYPLGRAKRHAEALAAAERILTKVEAERPELLSVDLYYTFGGIAYQAKNWKRAAEFYRLAIKLDPDNAAQAYNDLGYMWLELDMNIDEAGQLIERALELEPDKGAYVDSLGWYYYKKGDYETALVHLLRAAELAPADQELGDLSEELKEEARKEYLSVIFDHIGDTYHKLNQKTEALRYWKMAIAADPKLEGVQAKIDMLEAPPAAQAAITSPPSQPTTKQLEPMIATGGSTPSTDP